MIRTRTLVFISTLCLFCAADVPLFANIPLETVAQNGELKDPSGIESMLRRLREDGMNGIIADMWWSVVEQQPKQYNFKPYRQLLTLAEANGLRVKFILGFHDCGSTYGDDCDIKLPAWVLKERSNDVFYKDSAGSASESYISLFADEAALFGDDSSRRTPLQIYGDFIEHFSAEFKEDLNKTIDSVVIGLGPSGQLRYPSYRVDKNAFCGVGSFQSFDKHALESLERAAVLHDAHRIASRDDGESTSPLTANTKFAGRRGVEEVFNYESKPNQTRFFRTLRKVCDLHPLQREACNRESLDSCHEAGCCWDETQDVKCYRQADMHCKLVETKEECGYWGISEGQCLQKGCCWEPNNKGKPYCFRSTGTDNYQTAYGRFFLRWYTDKLLEHGEKVLHDARLRLPSLPIQIKAPSVFWMRNDPSRAAEATAGYSSTGSADPYRDLMLVLRRYKVGLIFSGFDALNKEYNEACMANPEELLSKIISLADEIGVELIGEPTLSPLQQNARYNTVYELINGLNGYIPFRAVRNSPQSSDNLRSFIDKARTSHPAQQYTLKKLRRLLVILERLECAECLDSTNGFV